MKTILLILIVLTCSFLALAQDSEAIYKRAYEHYQNKRCEEAIKDLSEVIRLRPEIPNPYGLRAICYYEIQIAQKSPRLIKIEGVPLIYKAEKNVKAVEDNTKAIQLSEPLSASSSKLVYEFYINRHLANLADYDYRPAIADLKAIVKVNPNYEVPLVTSKTITAKEYLVNIQNAYADYLISYTRGLNQAISFAEKLLAVRFDAIENAKMEQDKANVKKLYLDAIENYQPDASLISTKRADIYSKRGYANSYVENWQAAIADFKESLKLKPNDDLIMDALASSYKGNKQFDLAIAEYDKIIASVTSGNFSKNSAKLERARILSNVGKADEALKYFNERIAKDPQDYLYLDRGRVYLKKGNKQLARADFNKAIELAKNVEFGYYTVNAAQKELDILDGKIKPEIEKKPQTAVQPKPTPTPQAVQPKPTPTTVVAPPKTVATPSLPPLKSAEEYFVRGRNSLAQPDAALSDFSEAIRLKKNYFEAISASGDAYRQKGNYSQAIVSYNQALQINIIYVPAYIGRALVYSWSGKKGLAIADLEKAIKLDPNNQNAKNILEQIKK